jgi:hypothetical protein
MTTTHRTEGRMKSMESSSLSVFLLGSLRQYAASLVSDAQADGDTFLCRGIPRSFLLLLDAFLVVYTSYWIAALLALSNSSSCCSIPSGYSSVSC